MKYTYFGSHGLFVLKKSERLSNIRPIEHMTLTYIKTCVMVKHYMSEQPEPSEMNSKKIAKTQNTQLKT